MYQVCITHMMDNKPWNAENEPTCTQLIVLLVSQSIPNHFGCSRARFEGNYIYYQMTGHNWSQLVQSQSVAVLISYDQSQSQSWLFGVSSHLTSCSHGQFGQMTWPDLTCKYYLCMAFHLETQETSGLWNWVQVCRRGQSSRNWESVSMLLTRVPIMYIYTVPWLRI